MMAQIRFQQESFEDAIVHAKEVIEHSDHPGGYANLVASLGWLGRVEEAKGVLRRYGEISPISLAEYVRVAALSTRGDPEREKRFLDGLALAGVETEP
jgi:hypothetical protein